jgi:site-specific DNA-methyltransferase (adenine-specific)
MTIWVVGPIAWDTVVYTENPLNIGGFAQGEKIIERPGGTGANVARALVTTSIPTAFVGYVGNDGNGDKLIDDMTSRGFEHLDILRIAGSTSHVLIVVDPSSERTIVGLAPDNLECVTLDENKLSENDVVVFVLWREHFFTDLIKAKQAGCRVVVGLDAINDPRVSGVDVAIGSIHDVHENFNAQDELERFQRIVVTEGVNGSTEFSQSGKTKQTAVLAEVVDATGAGDAFLAGYVTAMTSGIDSAEERLRLGATWAARTVETESSIPPSFNRI